MFFQNSRDSVCFKKGDRKRKVYLKSRDRNRKLVSNIGTGKENGSQILGPEKKMDLKYWDRKYLKYSDQKY